VVGKLLGQMTGLAVALMMGAACQTMPFGTDGTQGSGLSRIGLFDRAPIEAAFMNEDEPRVAAPNGFMAFCLRNPDQCSAPDDQAQTVPFDDHLWDMLKAVNEQVNRTVTNEDDKAHYGRAEYWTIVTDGYGDCEDFALTKRKELIDAGFPEKALRIAIGRTWRDELHAVLTVATDCGDYVLDNRTWEILPWNRTEYRWVSRQDANNPMGWVTLQGRFPTRIAAPIAATARTAAK